MALQIFKVVREDSIDYDEYSGFICVAANELEARQMHPRPTSYIKWSNDNSCWMVRYGVMEWEREDYHSWTNDIDSLTVTLVGESLPGPDGTQERGVLLASFHAG